VKTAKIVIDKNIGEADFFAQMFGDVATTFSSSDMSTFLNDNSDATNIEVEIRSDGGSVTQGFEIYDLLKNSGKPVKTIAYKANSIATVIFLAGTERVITKNAQFVIHNPFIDPMNLGYSGLTADDLHAIADDIKQCENKIFNLYKEVLNLDANSEIEVKNLMAADTDLTADNALKYGFATAIINGGETQSKALKNTAYSSKIAALLKDKNNNNNMDNKEIKSQLDKIAGSLKNLFKVNNLNENGEPIAVQNSTATAADGTVMYFTEDTLAVGVAVFSDEAMSTPIADGTYVVDGSDVSVSGGLVAQIETIEDAKTKMANLETENSTLKAELENLKAENATVKASNETIVNELKTFKTEFENLKKVIPNDVKNLKDLPAPELTPAQKHLQNRKKFN
jgi:ATP-dependent protease ClpP protease subunit